MNSCHSFGVSVRFAIAQALRFHEWHQLRARHRRRDRLEASPCDLWGDAVDTASRMESQSTPGEIQIMRATCELLKDEFDCRRRGTIEVKGNGRMETWYLVGPRRDDL
jgi:class 3 adenylate cyclase